MFRSMAERWKQNRWSMKSILCVLFFASAAWLGVNSIWVELPLIVQSSPQQWKLPAYLTVVIQVANIVPLLYLLLSKYVKIGGRRIITEQKTIYSILILDVILSFMLAFTWGHTSIINGNNYSTWLITINFLIAAADAMTSVTFLPFMAYFPQQYMVVYYIGAGMSGFIPSITALIQGLGKQSHSCQKLKGGVNDSNTGDGRKFPPDYIYNLYADDESRKTITNYEAPHFTVKTFFCIVASFLFLSLLAFILLVRIKKRLNSAQVNVNGGEMESPSSQVNTNGSEMEPPSSQVNTNGGDIESPALQVNTNSNDIGMQNIAYDSKTEPQSREGASSQEHTNTDNVKEETTTDKEKKLRLNGKVAFILLFNVVISCFSNGVLPALQSYACLPYGNNIYHLTLILSSAINPMACFLYFFASVRSQKMLLLGVLLYLASASYTITIASTSPCPMMQGTTAGGIIVLVVSVLGVGLVSYLRTAIGTILQQQGHKALLLCGISVQVGSLIGALTMFPLVSVYGIFKQSEPCQTCK